MTDRGQRICKGERKWENIGALSLARAKTLAITPVLLSSASARSPGGLSSSSGEITYHVVVPSHVGHASQDTSVAVSG